MTIVNRKKSLAAKAAGIVPGLKKHFTNGSQVLAFAGADATNTVDETVANLGLIVGNRSAVEAAQKAATTLVDTENATLPALALFLAKLEAFLRVTFGGSASTLGDFGLPPRKARAPMTAEQKAVAAAKREATRLARGITTKKAKKALKGNVTATLVVTPQGATAPAAAAPAPVVAAPAVTPPKG